MLKLYFMPRHDLAEGPIDFSMSVYVCVCACVCVCVPEACADHNLAVHDVI